jgi:anti-anti-sigma factor
MSLLVRTEQKAGQPQQSYTRISFAWALADTAGATVESSQLPRIDSTNANRLEDVFLELLAQAEKTSTLLLVIVDLSNVAYISSAGLRVLIALYNRLCERRGAISLVVPQCQPRTDVPRVIENLEETGMDRVFQSATTEEAAVALLANRLSPKVKPQR